MGRRKGSPTDKAWYQNQSRAMILDRLSAKLAKSCQRSPKMDRPNIPGGKQIFNKR